jgi:transposase
MPKNNKNKRYTEEFKASLLKRLEQPTTDTVKSLSEELEIPRPTIYEWIKKNKTKNDDNKTKYKSPNKWTSEDKFQIVLETSTLNETELAQYCRRKGIFADEVKTWRKQCLNANEKVLEDPNKLKDSLKEEQKRNKDLQRELTRKEKALAETAALLVLRKKAQSIWGEHEED